MLAMNVSRVDRAYARYLVAERTSSLRFAAPTALGTILCDRVQSGKTLLDKTCKLPDIEEAK
jgi:hypothetical protein